MTNSRECDEIQSYRVVGTRTMIVLVQQDDKGREKPALGMSLEGDERKLTEFLRHVLRVQELNDTEETHVVFSRGVLEAVLSSDRD